jgi:hypothetical protein
MMFAALEAAHDAVTSSPLAVLELVEDVLALRVADALDDHLLGGLGRDAAEALAVLPHLEHVAEVAVLLARLVAIGLEVEDLEAELLTELRLEAVTARVLHRDLALRVLHILDDRHVLEQVDVARVAVEARLELAGHSEGPLRSGEDRLLHGLHQDAGLDALLLADLLDDGVERNARALHD